MSEQSLFAYASLLVEEAFDQIIHDAIAAGASDVYFQPNEDNFTVAFRQYGVQRHVAELPSDIGRRLISHVKVVAGMDHAERRRPQDGRQRYHAKLANTPPTARVDLRINTLPTMFGEDCTIRLLRRDFGPCELNALGMANHDVNHALAMIYNPSGLILCTGPTGSGKTTTLYAFLKELNNGRRKINTIEDPVEYTVEGVRQTQINPAIHLDFPELLRSVLRQSPDVILIGEIRDDTTAQVTVQAANSGHLVLSTLHSPVAVAAIQSMRGLHVHAQFLATALTGVISQRLVRTLCHQCRKPVDIAQAPNAFSEIKQWLGPDEGHTLYAPIGCDACGQSGYRGQTGLFEVLHVSPAIRQLISDGAPTAEIRRTAVKEGMLEFRQSALLNVARGETSLEEVFRVVPSEYLVVQD